MIVTITQLRVLAVSGNGEKMPIGKGHVASQTMTAAGTSAAFATGATMIRVATDTTIAGNFFGAGSDLLPAGAVEYFPAIAGQTITFVEA